MSQDSNTGTSTDASLAGRNAANQAKATRTALYCAGLVCFMTGLAFASVPLYDLFCRMTGFGGTPMVSSQGPSRSSDRIVQVRFDANVAPALGWRFEAETSVVNARVGETQTVFYKVTNTSDRPTTGIATFNVQPSHVGAFFVKMQCFCFTEHTLQPGESMNAPVVFYIDPDFETHRDLRNVNAMTLSYTYFPSRNGQPVAGLPQGAPLADATIQQDKSKL
jgi:cytochrome c oxidase assembly protein subunit 11